MATRSRRPITRGTIAQRVRGEGVAVLGTRVAGVALLFFMHVVVARSIGAEHYGTFSFATMTAALVGQVATLGWAGASVRFTAQFLDQRLWGFLRGVVALGLSMALLGGVLASGTLLGIALGLDLPPEQRSGLLWAAALAPLIAIRSVRRGILQGLGRSIASVVPDELAFPVLVLSGVWLLAARTSSTALAVHLAASLIVLGVAALWIRRSIPGEAREASPRFQTSDWIRIALPMALGGLAFMILNRTDVIMLGVLSEMSEVGIYSAATRFAILLTWILGSLQIVVTPILAASHHGGRREEFAGALRSAQLWGFLVALPLFLALVVFPRQLLSLLGAEFGEGADLLRVLAVAQMVNVTTGPVGSALQMSGRQVELAASTSVAALANLAGNLFAIPRWGAMGAAIVTTVCVGALNLWLCWVVFRQTGASRGSTGGPV